MAAQEPTQEQAFQDLLGACRAKQEAGVLASEEVRMVERARNALVAAELVSEATIAGVTVEQMVGTGVPLGAAAALKKAFPGTARVHLLRTDGVWTNQARQLESRTMDLAQYEMEFNVKVTAICVTEEPLDGEELQRIQWQSIKVLSVTLNPGQHVYLKEKPGRHWLIKAFML